ncbi:transposase [Kocuria soli]|uniref:transposase n=1 Tax=Kocuria soli TaxID=2485125 RepID=UPI001F48C80D|nr:transposase [Kocuria soli]
MDQISLLTWGLCLYGLALAAAAWGFDILARRTSQRAVAWRTNGFVYHESHDAWLCPEDQWLWPTSFDPDNRVMRYRGKADICNACPVKDTCTVSDHGKQLTREVDPWPHSENGRFHRGVAVAVGAMGVIMLLAGMLMATTGLEVLVLAVTAFVVAVVCAPLVIHLVRTPTGAPDHIVHHNDREALQAMTTDRFAAKWGGDSRGNDAVWGGVTRERLPIEPVQRSASDTSTVRKGK